MARFVTKIESEQRNIVIDISNIIDDVTSAAGFEISEHFGRLLNIPLKVHKRKEKRKRENRGEGEE